MREIAIIAASNDQDVLQNNLLASPLLRCGNVTPTIEQGHRSASAAYNAGLSKISAPLAVFVHQDVYIPGNWERSLFSAIDQLETSGQKWGMLGLVGICSDSRIVGRSWSTGIGHEVGARLSRPEKAESVDEMLFVLRTDCGFRFDENLPGYHLYATDMAMIVRQAGYEVYVIDAPVIHNSRPVHYLDRQYAQGYRYMQKKWHGQLPLKTCVIPVTRGGWPLMRNRMVTAKRMICGQVPLGGRSVAKLHPQPNMLAAQLGYESSLDK